MNSQITITIGIPNFNRPSDLDYLLYTISRSHKQPEEILICDDRSPEIIEIEKTIDKWAENFEGKLKFIKNKINLGYDKNIKKLIKESSSSHILLIGNDDALPEYSLSFAYKFIEKNKDLSAFSRSFLKFTNNINYLQGVSRSIHHDDIIKPEKYSGNQYLRSSAYFGGLILNRNWALSKETDLYDGSLYYQVYLYGCAFYEGGIGYMDYPLVAGRVDGIPLFGHNPSERKTHQPGGFSAEARLKMWNDIIQIATDLDKRYKSNSVISVKNEIGNRLSFHVFENFSNKKTVENIRLVKELYSSNLLFYKNTIIFFFINILLGNKSRYFYRIARFFYQK